MSLLNAIMAGASESSLPTTVAPEGVDFDGVSDYLSRSTDLVGNVDSKTFTFSAWVWLNKLNINQPIFIGYDGNGTGFYLSVQSNNKITISANSVSVAALSMSIDLPLAVKNTFFNILISINLSDFSKRYVYINDILASVTWTTYTNVEINFKKANQRIGNYSTLYTNFRLSNIFLDYTYRDLSIEANRRLFITSDGKPTPTATLKALNPIIYLPMKDAATAHINEGTGGNFTLNGVIATSGRGANQFNAPYSDLDGTADYLSRGIPNGAAASSAITVAISFNADTLPVGGAVLFSGHDGTRSTFRVQVTNVLVGDLRIYAQDATGASYILATTSAALSSTRNYVLVASFDTSDSAKRHFYLNGEAVSVTWAAAGSFNVPVNNFQYTKVGVGGGSTQVSFYDGKVSSVFFHTSYIDLSVASNLAKFVTGTGIDAKPVGMGANGELPFGTPPLIYLPLDASNAGKNYGTGGDFTANSAPYVGARGASEFWGNLAAFNGSNSYLTSATTVGLSNTGKTVSFVLSFSTTNFSSTIQSIFGADTDGRLRVLTDGRIQLLFKNTTGADAINMTTSGTVSSNIIYTVFCAIDTSSTSKRYFSLNGNTSVTWNTYLVDALIRLSTGFNGNSFGIGVAGSGIFAVNPLNGRIAELYVTDQYIDFSQEANRLKFRDAFGNPVDLAPQIEAGTLPNPAIYMRFDPSNFGKNSGTGGDFTVNGTIIDGGQL